MIHRDDICLRDVLDDPSMRLLMGRNGVRPGEMARAMAAFRSEQRAGGGRFGGTAPAMTWPPAMDRLPALLAHAADMLAEARSAGALRHAVAFTFGLARGIIRLVATDRAARLSNEQRRLLHDHATYVISASGSVSCPDDVHIETFITLARRDSDWLADAVNQAEEVFSVA